MRRLRKPARALRFSLLLAGSFSAALADRRVPTPLSEALTAHELVLVGTVKERFGGKVKVEPIHVIKGQPPDGLLQLPDTWTQQRQGTKPLPPSFGLPPVGLDIGKTYLLMLQRDPGGGYAFSSDFGADAVAVVSGCDDPLVRAANVLYSLSQEEKPDSRKKTLIDTWEKDSDETKVKLLRAFHENPADAATVPFLMRCMNAGAARSGLVAPAAKVIQKHEYKETIPGLIAVLQKGDWTNIYAARTLGRLKAREAYQPIMDRIGNTGAGNQAYLIEALCFLEDKRSLPFLIKTLPRNLPGLDPSHGTYRSWSIQENEFAVTGLGRLRAREAVEPLVQLLDLDNYNELRTLAVKALGEIGPPARRALPKIKQLTGSGKIPGDVAEEAMKKINLEE